MTIDQTSAMVTMVFVLFLADKMSMRIITRERWTLLNNMCKVLYILKYISSMMFQIIM